jgi:hypothetical protein
MDLVVLSIASGSTCNVDGVPHQCRPHRKSTLEP